jgi:hypothetical protein
MASGFVTVHNNALKTVVCLVSWRYAGKAVEEHGDQVQVERLALEVEVVPDAPDAPYDNYLYAPWAEAKQRIMQLHNVIQNHMQILSIEPECSCLGPCRYPERTRFWLDLNGASWIEATLHDRDKPEMPIAAGGRQDMELLLERHRRSNHHQ